MKNLKHLTKRSLALFLVLVMCLGMMQIAAFADEPDTTPEPDSTIQTVETAGDSGQETPAEEEGEEETPPASAPAPTEEEEEEEETLPAPAPAPAEEEEEDEEEKEETLPAPAPATTAEEKKEEKSTIRNTSNKVAPRTTMYQVIFDANGGTGTPPDPLSVPDWTFGLDSLPDQGNLTKDGYKFAGWAQKASGTTPTTPGNVWVVGGNVTLYAIWEEDGQVSFTVSLDYDLNGRAATIVGHPAKRINAGETVSWTVKDCSVKPPEGKVFAGWNTQEDGTGDTYQAGATFSVTPTEDMTITLYAQWKAIVNTMTVKYLPNGGSGVMADEVYEANQYGLVEYAVSECKFTPPVGKKFSCWGHTLDSVPNTWQPSDKISDFLTSGSKVTTYVAKWVDDPDYVPTRSVDLYVHFVPEDKDAIVKPAFADVNTTFALTYSYTVNGKETTETLTYNKAEHIPNYSQIHGLDGSLYHNDPALKWNITVPVAVGTAYTTVNITQANYTINGFTFVKSYPESFNISSLEAANSGTTAWHVYDRYKSEPVYRELPITLRLTYLGLDESKLPLNTQTLFYELHSDDKLIKSGTLKGSDAEPAGKNGGYPCYKWDLGSISFPVGGTTTLKVTPAGGAVDGYLFGFADENGAAITNAKTNKGEGALTLDISSDVNSQSIKGYSKDFFYAYTERTVTVRWVDEDGTELFKQENVKLSAIPEAGKYNELSGNAENPTKASDDKFDYTFDGWNDAEYNADKTVVTYKARYTPTEKQPPVVGTFTVRWMNGYTSTPIQSETYNVGTTSYRDDDPANPTRTNYSFTGWVEAVTQTDDNGNVTVITITAQWKEDTFTVTWLNGYDGGQVDAKTYGRATQATTYQGEYPANPTRPGSYRFTGWGAPVDDGNGNLTITAQWRYTGGSSEGGGGGGGSDPTPPRPTNPDPENPPVDIPDEQPPLTEDPTLDIPDVELPDEDVPLADIPDEQPPLAEEPEVEIPEEEVPLAGVPQTGEASVTLWLAAALTAGAGLVYVNTGKRKEENQ